MSANNARRAANAASSCSTGARQSIRSAESRDGRFQIAYRDHHMPDSRKLFVMGWPVGNFSGVARREVANQEWKKVPFGSVPTRAVFPIQLEAIRTFGVAFRRRAHQDSGRPGQCASLHTPLINAGAPIGISASASTRICSKLGGFLVP